MRTLTYRLAEHALRIEVDQLPGPHGEVTQHCILDLLTAALLERAQPRPMRRF